MELFNLRHAMARNVIERIFGVLKRRFRILIVPPELDMHWQARLPAALTAIHDFIQDHDPDDINDIEDPVDPDTTSRAQEGELASGIATVAERSQVNERRDKIAELMWNQYLAHCEV